MTTATIYEKEKRKAKRETSMAGRAREGHPTAPPATNR